MELKTLMCERFFCSSYRTVLYVSPSPLVYTPYVCLVLLTLRGDKDMEILFIYLNKKLKNGFQYKLFE